LTVTEEEYNALMDRMAALEGDYERLKEQLTSDRVGALVEKYVKSHAGHK
jgi:hypothetical protein